MGILDFFGRKKNTAVNAMSGTYDVANITSTAELADFVSSGSETSSGERVGTSQSLTVAAFYRGVNVLVGAIGAAPIEIKNELTLELDLKNPIRKLLNRTPNSWQTAREFKKQLHLSVILCGNGYALKVKSRGNIIALIPMAANSVQVKQKSDKSIEYKYTAKDGRVLTLTQDDVFHIRGFSLDGIVGVSVLTYAREVLGGSLSASKHGNALFKNGTNIGSVLSHPSTLGKEAQDLLRSSMDSFRGSDKAGKTLILEEAMTYTPIGMSQVDADFINSRKLSIIEISMFLGVPTHILGFTEGNTQLGSSMEQQSALFVNYDLNDQFGMWEGPIERDLLNDDRLIAEFSDRKLLRGDTKSRWESHVLGASYGLVNPDEVRRKEGMPARKDGKGGEYYPPPNMTDKALPAESKKGAK